MGFKKDELFGCVGAVNILLNNRIVLQGLIIRNHEEDRKNDCPPKVNVEVENENEFITVELTCDALIIRNNAQLRVISPTLFEERDRVRINVSEISAIGPSHGCPEEEEELVAEAAVVAKCNTNQCS